MLTVATVIAVLLGASAARAAGPTPDAARASLLKEARTVAKAATGAAPHMPAFVKAIISDSITHVFSLGLYLVAAAAVVIIFIPHVPMRDRSMMGAQASDKDDETVIPAEAHL